MADDWDLQAVVRGCTTNPAASCSTRNVSTATNTAIISTTPTTSASGATYGNNNHLSFIPQQDMYFRNGGDEELQELYKSFLPPPSPPLSPPAAIPISPLSVIGGLQDLSKQMQHLQHQTLKPRHNLSMSVPSRTKTSIISTIPSHNSRSKRRKTQMKRVVEIAAEALSSDTWSWRKYGQKPIKGSPYPRGYYKCSTSKGCLARKQVERKRSDPGMFIVNYTADHNHPIPAHKNSLAGSSRHKPETSGEPRTNPCSSHPVSPSVSGSPGLEKIEIDGYNDDIVEDEDGNIMNAPEMKIDDEFFEGLEDLEAVSGVSNSFSQDVKVQVPWLTNDITSKGEDRFDF